MAIYYVDNILGNDANLGTTASPWKSVNKGLQNCVDGDEVWVAGGSFSALPGFLTYVARGATAAVSSNWTTLGVSAGSTLAFDTSTIDGWPLEYSLFQVGSITSTTLTFVSGQGLAAPDGTYSCWFFNSGTNSITQQYHYVSPNQGAARETITAFTASEVKVLGGWKSDFSERWGWTGCKHNTSTTVQTAQRTNAGLVFSMSNIIKPGVVFDKFLLVNTSFNNGSLTGAHGVGTMSFLNCMTGNLFAGSNWGVAGPTANSPMTLINNNCDIGNGSWNGGANSQENMMINYWTSVHDNRPNATQAERIYNGASLGFLYEVPEWNWRTNGSGTGYQRWRPNISRQQLNKIGKLNLYICATASVNLAFPSAINIKEGLGLFITDGSAANWSFGDQITQAQTITNYIKVAGVLEERPFTNGIGWGGNAVWNMKRFYNTQSTTIKDDEGLKVGIQGGWIYYADTSEYQTGSDSMRIKMMPSADLTNRVIPYIIAFSPKPPAGTFSISITAKTNNPTPLSVVPSFNYSDAPQTALLTTTTFSQSWQTYTYSVDTSALNWNDWQEDNPITIGFTCESNNISRTQSIYVWIDRVEVLS
jgi:hypothetical protein